MGCAGPCGDVIEFGCGYGTFTVPAASLVDGKIFALDIEPGLIEATSKKLLQAGLSNVSLEVRDFLANGCGRPANSAGYAVLFNILHIENPIELLREALRALKPGGLTGVIHWKRDPATPRGPSLGIRPTPEQCRKWAETAGFEFVQDASLCCCSWHYGLILRKPLHQN